MKNFTFNKTIIAWSLYDFANSAYALLVTGVAYQIYFKKVVFSESAQVADLGWAITVAASIIISALLSPYIGAAADAFALRRQLFVILTILSIVFTCSLFFVTANSIILGISLFFIANFCYNLALFLYDSYLKLISSPANIARTSGLGWGLGYLGGIFCLAITFPFFSQEPSVTNTMGFRVGFLIVGIFFFIFSLPAIKLLPSVRSDRQEAIKLQSVFHKSYSTTWQTVKQWRDHKEIFKFILAFWFVTEAIITVIYFMANYLSTTFGLQAKSILLLTVVIQLIGFPTTWIVGHFADKWDIKQALLVSIIIWIAVVLLIVLGKSMTSLYIMCGLMGLVIGSTQALGRALLSILTPSDKVSQFFGFNSFSTKIAATIGPLIFGVVSSLSGNQRLAWLSLLPFLLAGGLLILTVRSQNLERLAYSEGINSQTDSLSVRNY